MLGATGRGRLDGKVALVTGGASGIGRASCVLFASEGARVVVADLPGAPADETVELIRQAGGQAVAATGDVRSLTDAERVVEVAVAEFGGLDVLFNNAGVEYMGSVEEMPEDKWDLVVDTNLKGIYVMSKAAIPHLKRRGRGSIVNTASQLGWVATANFSAYCASKGGVLNMTRAGPQGTLQMLADLHALKRIAQPVELAYPALFLACDESSFMTGASLVVDGGYIAA